MKFGVKKRRLDGHGVPPGEDAVPHEAVFTGRMAGGQQDPHQPLAEEEQRDRRSDTTPSHATGGRNEESLGGGCSPPGLHTEQDLPVLQSSVVVRVPEHLRENGSLQRCPICACRQRRRRTLAAAAVSLPCPAPAAVWSPCD